MLSVLSRRFLRTSSNGFLPALRCSRNSVETERNPMDKNKLALHKYLLNKSTGVIEYCENKLERKFPVTIQVHRTYRTGLSKFILDTKQYIMCLIRQKLAGKTEETIEELQFCFTMAKDLAKVLPVLILLMLPFTQYVMFPLLYKFPRQLLSHHFWTSQQKAEFTLYYQKERLKHNRPLFRCLQAEVDCITDSELKNKWKDIIARLGSGTHPSPADVIACSSLFEHPPYSLESLKKNHIKELLAIHDIPTWLPFKITRLNDRAVLISTMDYIIHKRGVEKLPNDTLQWALSFRGVNPENMSMESMQKWMEDWLLVSKITRKSNVSLLLHAPLLLAYNYPTNWTLIYK